MSKLPKLLILDVGHGNCTILQDTEGVLMVDCPKGNIVPNTLAQLGITEINNLILSHSDADHIGGVMGLLENPRIKINTVYLNSDACKASDLWLGLCRALELAEGSNETRVDQNLNSANRQISCGTVSVEILAPSRLLSLRGAGSTDIAGNTLSSNSMSVVIRLVHNSHPIVLITSDMDEVCYTNLTRRTIPNNLQADILIFPHHGGHTNSPNEMDFARELCELVNPKLVVFSIGRGRYATPRQEIIQGVRLARLSPHILCTQLSENCSTRLGNSSSHLVRLPSQGRDKKTFCGGSVIVDLDGVNTSYQPEQSHRHFVRNEISQGLCIK